jgi:hypothetical protein
MSTVTVTTTTTTSTAAAAAAPAAQASKDHKEKEAAAATTPGPTINSTTHPLPFSFLQWIDANAAAFQPPVGNKMIHSLGCQFKVMVVSGPNTRTDYHINCGEEWYYMVKGHMVLKVQSSRREGSES